MAKLVVVLFLVACVLAADGGRIRDKIKEIKEKIRDKLNRGEGVTRPDNWADCLDQDVDAYLDKVLEQARKQLPEPMRLPPRSAFVELSEGRVWGMQTLHRSGPMIVTCLDNDTVVITGKLATDELKARYTWEKEFRKKKREGFVLVKTNDFEADVQLIIHKGHEHPKLEAFKIRRFKDISVEMTGLGWLTWALAEVTTMMSGIMQWAIARAVQGPLREALERELYDMTLS